MARKKRPRRRNDQYQLPQRVAAAQRYAAAVAEYKPRPEPPQRRLIAVALGMFLLCLGMALFFWMSARSLVHDLRANGVTVAATVTGSDNKPKYVRVRYIQGENSGEEVKLSEYAGMLPDLRADDALLVTYDPEDPSRVLSRSWVISPPLNLPAYGTSALALFTFGLTVAVVVRRRWILRTPWPDHPLHRSSDSRDPGSTAVRLTKP
jgi:hypothetical protein